jgi:low temperature requirement protein LtrA
VGTLATLSAVIEEQGRAMDAALVCLAGIGLTFGMWWVYYIVPSAQVLHAHRNRALVWGYGQMVIVASIIATGAGLHVAAYFIEHESHIGALATVLCVAIPVGIFLGGIYALYTYLVGRFDPFHVWLLVGTVGVVALAAAAAFAGIDMAICLIILMLAPTVTIFGYEVLGHRHQVEALAKENVATSIVAHPHVRERPPLPQPHQQ